MFWCLSWSVLAVTFVAMLVWSWVFKKRHLALPPSPGQVPATVVHPLQHLSATQLSKRYEAGTLKPSFVVATYISHIKKVNPYLNAMVFNRFDKAIIEAVKADEIWAAWRKSPSKLPKPSWLTGVPCTIKECIQVEGCPNASGHPNRKHIIAARDAPVVQRLRAAGAIVLGVTNTSQLCMWMESNNKVYGVTNNAYDTRCLVGGSSGGEGCAVSAFFSPFGVGSDIGGSIRMPAFFNGVFGYKPSVHLIPNSGQHPGARQNGKLHSVLTTGPLCRFAEDLLPVSLILSDGGFLQDPELFPPCPPLQKEPLKLKNKPLRVFAIEDLGMPFIHVAASQIQAVHDAAKALEDSVGATVTYLNLRDRSRCSGPVPEGWELFSQIVHMWGTLITSDPEEHTFSQLMSEGMESEIKPFREVVAWLRGKSAHTLMSILLTCWERVEVKVMSESSKEHNRQNLARFTAAMKRELQDDGVIICPTYPVPAPKHHDPSWMPFQWQYTGAFNCTGCPSTNVPMWDHKLRDVDVVPSSQDCREQGLPKDYHIPKGVQVVSNWGNDMLSLSVAIELEKVNVGKYRSPSWTVTPELKY